MKSSPQTVSVTGQPSQDPIKVAGAPVLRLVHHGLKRWHVKDSPSDKIVPGADFYIDCRGIQEHGLDRNFPDLYQVQMEQHSKVTLDAMEAMIIDGLRHLHARRGGTTKHGNTDDLISRSGEPYTVCFMCAWGCNRSPNTKAVLAKRLRAKGYQVELPPEPDWE